MKNNGTRADSFSVSYDKLVNNIITPVGISIPFDPNETPDIETDIHNTHALWDTGATNSVIKQSMAQALNLTPTGTATINHAGGQDLCNTYIINFYLPNKVLIYGVLVSECPDTVGGFGVIIGMDIIDTGDFVITNFQEKTVMSFRVPSVKTIDFVKELKQLNIINKKPGSRNDPCTCGSGKKYKKCCGVTVPNILENILI